MIISIMGSVLPEEGIIESVQNTSMGETLWKSY